MGLIRKLVLRLFGKKLDAVMDKYGISKTKISMVLTILLPAIEQLSETFGHPVKFPSELKDTLMAFGLWSLKDGLEPVSTPKPA